MWESLFEFIKTGYAVLALAKKNGSHEYISGIIVFLYKYKAYYAFSATDPTFQRIKGIGHFLQWEIIKYLKKRGCKYYEIGWNLYPIISEDVCSLKELNISLFKSLFGGKTYPLFRGEKFYSAEYLRKKRDFLTEKFIKIL